MTEYIDTEAACPVCHGWGRTTHAACGGNGYRGLGAEPCRECDAGIVVCRHCDGTGIVRRRERAGW